MMKKLMSRLLTIGATVMILMYALQMNAYAEEIEKVDLSNCTVEAIANQVYTGDEIKPAIVITNGQTILEERTDYTVSYKNNINVGTATVTVTASEDGTYTGSIEKTFKITAAKISQSTASKISDKTYTGSALTPSVTLTYKGKKLVKDKDYKSELNYSHNIKAGKATITVTGKGNYSGTKTVNFTIVPKKITEAKFSEISSQVYTGKELKPTIKVTDGKTTLNKDVDYTLIYSKNTNVGTATITVKGKGNYAGTKTITFKITAKKITKAKFTSVENKVYTGKEIKPNVKIIDGKTTLKKDTDYKLSYKNNTKIGVATITVTGKGNYTGTKTVTFKIIPAKVKLSKISTLNKKTTLEWKKVKGAGGYKIYLYKSSSKKYKLYKTVSGSKSSASFKDLSSGKFKVEAYKKVGKKTYTGERSDALSTVSIPSKPSLVSVGFSSSSKLKVSWKKVSKATSYEILYSTNSKFSSGVKTITASASATSKTISGLSSSKTYYVRMRAINTSSNRKAYGTYSSEKSTAYNNLYINYTSSYHTGSQIYRQRETNLKIACKAINGTVLSPGETFSFNQVVGERTAAKGYKPAYIFSGGGSVAGIGGGICQVASTIYNAALLSNFQIVQRHQHSQKVTYVPYGRDAAIYWGANKDLKFKNTSKYTVKIIASASNNKLSIKFYTSEYAKPAKVSLKVSRSGSHYTLKRIVGGKVNYTASSVY